MDDQLSQFIGLDIPKLQEETKEVREKRLYIATKVVKLLEYPEWKVFQEELDRLQKVFNKPCEVYMNNPNLAIYDSGQKRTLEIIKNFVEKQVKIIEAYVETQIPTSGEETGPGVRETFGGAGS